jgi:hypothetical protein
MTNTEALRLAEELDRMLEKAHCVNATDHRGYEASVDHLIEQAASLIREQQELIRTLEGTLKEREGQLHDLCNGIFRIGFDRGLPQVHEHAVEIFATVDGPRAALTEEG